MIISFSCSIDLYSIIIIIIITSTLLQNFNYEKINKSIFLYYIFNIKMKEKLLLELYNIYH